MESINHHYQQALATKSLLPDKAQAHAIDLLEVIIQSVVKSRKDGLFPLGKKNDTVKGAYIYGPVGRGKTMMLNWCVDVLQKHGKRVERWHFHQFMLAIHDSLNDLRAHSKDLENRIQTLADQWVKRLDVLCFDEFHVTDVADAMIMMPLFTRFIDKGLAIITTSNWAPENLYTGGLQRQRFLPFIDHLKNSLHVINVTGDHDYRQLKQRQAVSWLTPLNEESLELFEDQFRNLIGYDSIETHEIHVGNRTWTIPRASKSTACLDMRYLLDQPLGAADFIALSQRYPILFLDNLSPFNQDQNERAKRFIVMIDTLYENQVKLVVRSACAIDELYSTTGSLAFEFARTQSRLHDMTASEGGTHA